MSSDFLFARFNLHLKDNSKIEADITDLQELLYNSAVWAGAEDPEVFYESDKNVVGVSVPFENDIMLILEAGAILGQCQVAYEKSKYMESIKANWLSIVDASGKVLESPY